MPSSPNYKRDYQREREIETPKRKAERALRNRARRAFETKNGPLPRNVDVDHIKPLDKGGAALDLKNLRAKPAHRNRSFKRTSRGGVK